MSSWKYALTFFLLTMPVQAEPLISNLACEPPQEVMTHSRYLRSLTLDLAGRLPMDAEYERVNVEGGVSDAFINELLNNGDFAIQATRFHGQFLWNNLSTINLTAGSFRLGRAAGNLHWRRQAARAYRGADVPCLDEPARFDGSGRPVQNEDGQEGFVEVNPYWLPEGEMIKVCAFDAQETSVSSTGTVCNRRGANNDAECGCGPNLTWCAVNESNRAVTASMTESLSRFVQSVFERHEPYSALFDSRRGFMNGPLSHFYRYMTDITAGVTFEPLPVNLDLTPEIHFLDADGWTEYLLPEAHAGLLTHPAFLLRFQTNRARANRFYDAFLCDGFQAPEGGLPVADTGDALNPDLQQRTGCQYCHARLEPAAAHWGRWSEQGVGYLDAENFPQERSDCVRCAQSNQGCNAECRNFYHISSLSPEDFPYLGQLHAYRFLDENKHENVTQGPKRLAYHGIESNRLPHCIAGRTAEWLLGRSISNDEEDWLAQITREFVWSDLNFRALVKSIVSSQTYRSVQ